MTLQPILISGFQYGKQTNKKPFALIDGAFQELENAYIFRERIVKREGTKLIGRLRIVFSSRTLEYDNITTMTYTSGGTGVLTLSIFGKYGNLTKEPNSEIAPGSSTSPIIINLNAGATILTDSTGTGVFVITGAAPAVSQAIINYSTGMVTLTVTINMIAVALSLTLSYYPALPVMGITLRETEDLNNEQSILFDQIHAYGYDGSNFSEYSSSTPTLWDGTDYELFWSTNWRGSESSIRIYFVTNFALPTKNPVRYFDGSSWQDFTPILSGTTITNENLGIVGGGGLTFTSGPISNIPPIPGTVKVIVGTVTFRDTNKNGIFITSTGNSGTINYETGIINLVFSVSQLGETVFINYDYGTNYLWQSKLLLPYYGRMLAFNTWEGVNAASAVNYFSRLRFSQIGNPLNSILTGYIPGSIVNLDSWRSDVFGKGGFIDAPVNEQIVSCQFFKNTLIVQFERSTWQLKYVGEYGLPFIWERISSDFGSESTFSTILFDEGILSVADRAIVIATGNNVQRIDLDIPDKVFSFRNQENGNKRVAGVRNFQKEIVYWSYADGENDDLTYVFPNRVLVYNYRNNTYADFRESITCFGQIYSPNGITWDSETVVWDDPVLWDDFEQEQFEVTVCGNQQGFIHFYGYPELNIANNSLVNALDQESLSITGLTIGSNTTELKVVNHNLEDLEIIMIVGAKFLDGITPDPNPNINNRIFMVETIDKDNIEIYQWDQDVNGYDVFLDPGTGDYIGNGRIALFRIPNITTKDFNPFKNQGMNFKTSYLDILADATPNSALTVNYMLNSSPGTYGNAIIGQKEIELCLAKMGFVLGATNANPCVITSLNHGLLDGDKILFSNVQGMDEINGVVFNIVYLTSNTFEIDVDSTGYGTYTFGGDWEQTNGQFYIPGSNYAWHRFFASCMGQYIAINFTYDNFLKNQLSTHQQLFEINALQLWCLPGGKNIFGR